MRKPTTGEPCAGEPHAQFGGQLVEQVNLGVTHDHAADGNPLTLAAGERLGQSFEIGLHLEHPCGLRDGGIDRLTRLPGKLEGKAHVPAHVHARIQPTFRVQQKLIEKILKEI